MRRRTTNVWILIGIVVVLALGAVAEKVRDRMLQPTPLLGIATQSVREIAIECGRCVTRRFAHVQGAWEMTEPYEIAADGEMLERVLEIAHAPVRHRYPASDFDPAKIGLAPPLASVHLGSWELQFGTTDAINNLRYVRYGQRVVLVADRFTPMLLAPPEVFVDRHPFVRLGSVASVAQDGVAWPGDRLGKLRDVIAERVMAAPDSTTGSMIDIALVSGRQVQFVLAHNVDNWSLRRPDQKLAYVLGDAVADTLQPAATP